MNPTERFLTHLLDCALRGRAPDGALAGQVDWPALFTLAQAHKVDAMLLDPICLLPDTLRPPANVLAAWQENAMLTVMGQVFIVEQLHALLGAFEAAGVKAVALKGVALKMLYPQPDLRTMSDADLLVAEASFEAANSVMISQGYALVEREPAVNVYQGPDGLRVELHSRLFDKTAYGFLSRLDEASLFPLSLAERVPVHGGEAWVFPPKEHALFMLCHMAKHMITTGFGLRQTLDFMLFAEANANLMDWPAFWQAAAGLGLAPFAAALLALGVTYFSLPAGPWANGAPDASPDAAQGLLEDLIDAGVFGNRTEERRRSAAVVYRAYDTDDADTGRVRRALFPSASSLKAPYLYARRHPALLPVAWLHRLARYGWELLTGKARRKDAAAGMQIADARLILLKQLGLRDDQPS
ncbi:MAG: nucleotidyltransferase family protein [Firmicutes bacterium]|nr:nucleotidyltransferase family protein [Bacillota bacterium]